MEINIPFWAVSMIVVFVGILGAFAVQRFIAFRAASVKFRSAVLTALNGLYPHPVNWPSDGMAIHQILSAAFPTLQAAVVEFHDALPRWHRRAFNNAWFRYRLGPDGRGIDKQCYDQYVAFGSNPNYKAIFHANVSRLLRYAKET